MTMTTDKPPKPSQLEARKPDYKFDYKQHRKLGFDDKMYHKMYLNPREAIYRGANLLRMKVLEMVVIGPDME